MITVTIKSSGDTKYELEIDPSITVGELKQQIATKADIPADSQRLIYSGKVLKDDQTVELYKVSSGHTIHLVKSAAKTSSATPAASSTSPAPAAPTNIAAGSGSYNPLADLTGARYAGFGPTLPSALMFGPDGGMNLGMPDPDQLTQMMLLPMFQEQMNAMLNDPQMMEFMFQQNPQLRAMAPQMRSMMQLPFFRQMMLNPEMMRSMMDMSREMGGGMGGMGGMGNLFGGAGAGAGAASGFPAPGSVAESGEAGGAGAPTNSTSDTSSNAGATGAGAGGAGAAGAAANPFAQLFGGGMGGLGGLGGFGGAPADSRPPEEKWATQLQTLNDMGFVDPAINVVALTVANGNVQGAIDYLLRGG